MTKPEDEDENLNLSRYLQARMREWIAAHPGSSAASLSVDVHMSKSTITKVHREGRGAGRKMARAFTKLWGGSVGAMYDAADEWAAKNPEPAAADSSPGPNGDDPYPNRARALEMARDLEINAEAIALVAALPGFKAKEEPSIAWWLARIELEAARIEGTAPRRGGVVLAAEAPPRGR